jgi:hypothetical protein
MKCVLTPQQEAALMLVNSCFGNGSPEALRFCKFLVVEQQGLEWIDDDVDFNPLESGSAQ